MNHNLPGTFTAYIIAPPIDWATSLPALIEQAPVHRVERGIRRIKDELPPAHTNDFGFFKFRHQMRGDEAVHTLRTNRYEPATLRELVGCVRGRPNLGKTAAVLAGGTLVRDRAAQWRIPCFHNHSGQLSILFDFYRSVFDPCWHFLVRLPQGNIHVP